jgi:hypothetical protein
MTASLPIPRPLREGVRQLYESQKRPIMSRHLYHVGEAVTLTPNSGNVLKNDGAYVVSALVPALGDEFQYRIKSASEPYERVVPEHQLNRAEAGAAPPASAPVAPVKAALKKMAGSAVRASSLAPTPVKAASRRR